MRGTRYCNCPIGVSRVKQTVKIDGFAFRNFGYFIIACLCLLFGCAFSACTVDFSGSVASGQSIFALRASLLSAAVLGIGVLTAAFTRLGFCAVLFLYGLSCAGCVPFLRSCFGAAAAVACCLCFLPRCCLLCWIALDLSRRRRVALYLLLIAAVLAAQYFLEPIFLLPLLVR